MGECFFYPVAGRGRDVEDTGLMGVYRFGAVLEEFEVRDALENVFSTL